MPFSVTRAARFDRPTRNGLLRDNRPLEGTRAGNALRRLRLQIKVGRRRQSAGQIVARARRLQHALIVRARLRLLLGETLRVGDRLVS